MALYSIETFGQLQPYLQQEWLLTNGLGGYASSTVVGCNTRRYHGLLVAATMPPVGRIMALNRVGEVVVIDGDAPRAHELAVNQFRDNFHPHGEIYLRKFELEDAARWEFDVAGVRIVKEVQVPWMKNVVGIRYTVDVPAGRTVELKVLPFVSLRDFHATRHAAGNDMPTGGSDGAMSVSADARTLYMRSDGGAFVKEPRWWHGHVYAIETDRGLDDSEDLFNPGYFSRTFAESGAITFWAALEENPRQDWDLERKRRRHAVGAAGHLPENVSPGGDDKPIGCGPQSLVIQKLARAANDFVVYRKSPDGSDGTSVIAGYPWFADWGRDTMIALPGLLLTTRRFAQAKQVLSVFANYVSEGMIPNRFDDYTNEPHYNTVDASLWFIHAAFEYLRLSEDYHTFEKKLQPACTAIIAGYRAGTRFHIAMDERDGLVTQGDAQTQLTWMDAKCGNVAFTPRQGKAVEINALWHHALVLMNQKDLAAKVRESFVKAFWISPFRGLADVVQSEKGTYQRDMALRPNQIFAVSLEHSPLSREQQAAVVEVVRRELLTPVGLRSLARSDRNYHGRYSGPPFQRDEAYHNGTVWGWLIGPFLEAYLRVHENSSDAVEQARRWLSPLIDHLDDACLGQISEIFEGDEPHRAVGCFAQAWSVAEALRLAVKLGM